MQRPVRPWTEFRPEMVDYARLTESMQWVLLLVIFGMAIFGVANTLLMSSFERRREFALLLALGARPRMIAGSVLAEAVALATLACWRESRSPCPSSPGGTAPRRT